MSDELFTEAMAAASAAREAISAEAPEPADTPVEGSAPESAVAEDSPPVVKSAPEVSLEASTVPPAKPAEQPKAEARAEPLAPRLVKLMEREAATVVREQKLKEAEADVTALRAQVKSITEAQARFKQDPISFLRQFAPEMKPAELAKALWYEELGEAAPIEHRVAKTERAAKQTVEELRAELEEQRKATAEATQNAAMEAAHQQYIGALSAIAAEVPESFPLVKAFSSQDPERVTRGLYRMAQKHARATNGEVATPEQCAEMLQKELAALQGVLSPSPAAPPASQTAPKGQEPASLRNKHTSVQPSKNTPESPEELFEAAMQAAKEASARLAGV